MSHRRRRSESSASVFEEWQILLLARDRAHLGFFLFNHFFSSTPHAGMIFLRRFRTSSISHSAPEFREDASTSASTSKEPTQTRRSGSISPSPAQVSSLLFDNHILLNSACSFSHSRPNLALLLQPSMSRSLLHHRHHLHPHFPSYKPLESHAGIMDHKRVMDPVLDIVLPQAICSSSLRTVRLLLRLLT